MGQCFISNSQKSSLKMQENDPTTKTKLKTTIKVLTLNYSGIMNCPFEFYCKQFQKQLQQFSSIFKETIWEYYPAQKEKQSKFDWNMGKIDIKIRKGRYSNMFSPFVGIQNGKFISKKRFQQLWDQEFKKICKKNKFQCTEKEKANARNFDLVFYHTCLKYIFQITTIDQALKMSQTQIMKFQGKLGKFFSLSFLSKKNKLQKLLINLPIYEYDIFFLQEYSKQFKQKMQQNDYYHIEFDKNQDCLIIASKAFFKNKNKKEDNTELFQQLANEVKWIAGTAYMVLDNKYILICSHLSSNDKKNPQQIKQLKSSLIDLQSKFPNYVIILGGDLNSFLERVSQQFHVFPTQKTQYTTVKKRTYSQCQFDKGDVPVKESKDKIISTLQIGQNSSINFINQQKYDQNCFLPTNEHPFDHFTVVAQLKLPKIN